MQGLPVEISDMIIGYLGYEFTSKYRYIPLLKQYIAKLPNYERAYSLNNYKYLHYNDPAIRKARTCSSNWKLNGVPHRYDGPAITEYHDNGNPKLEIYYSHGVIHRDNGPAYITYYEDGQIYRCWWGQNGYSYRSDGQPTFEEYKDGSLVKASLFNDA